ncbi:MAG: hypothetical protein RJB04_1345 [Verrucomicrobiota bacterium]|jgi:hypothetical protein
MKVRWVDSIVRFRMRPLEVADWMATGQCTGGVQIGPLAQDRWAYRLELDSGPDWKISIEAGHWNVAIPRTAVQLWTDSEAITLEHLTPWGTRLILEKDLPRRLLRPGNGDT